MERKKQIYNKSDEMQYSIKYISRQNGFEKDSSLVFTLISLAKDMMPSFVYKSVGRMTDAIGTKT